MAFREVSVVEVREVLRGWLGGAGLRTVAGRAGVDRKTARRYVTAAEAAGVVRDGGVAQLTDEVIGQVVGAVRPARAGGHGQAWEALEAEREQVSEWVGKDLSVVKVARSARAAGRAGPAPHAAPVLRRAVRVRSWWPHHGAGRGREAEGGVPD
jgi:hypothetical protein